MRRNLHPGPGAGAGRLQPYAYGSNYFMHTILDTPGREEGSINWSRDAAAIIN